MAVASEAVDTEDARAGRHPDFDTAVRFMDRVGAGSRHWIHHLKRLVPAEVWYAPEREGRDYDATFEAITEAMVRHLTRDQLIDAVQEIRLRDMLWCRLPVAFRRLPRNEQKKLVEFFHLGDKFVHSDRQLVTGDILGSMERWLGTGDDAARQLVRGGLAGLGIPGHAVMLWTDQTGRTRVRTSYLDERGAA